MNSKVIGGNYERIIAKKLSKWFTGNDNELVCWRTAGSGNVGTIRKKKGLSGNNVDGDFQCLDSKYESFFNKFHMDSKSLTDINLFMINPKNQKSNKLLNEWKKVVKDAGDKIPMMFVKVRDDRSIPEFIIMPGDDFSLSFNIDSFIKYDFLNMDYNFNFILILQDDFFESNQWENFMEEN